MKLRIFFLPFVLGLFMWACPQNPPPTNSPHAVTLSWMPPASTFRMEAPRLELASFSPAQANKVSSYAVYRASCSGVISLAGQCPAEGVFGRIGTTTLTTYIDSTVISKAQYSYYVTAIYTAQGESGPSNHMATSIP